MFFNFFSISAPRNILAFKTQLIQSVSVNLTLFLLTEMIITFAESCAKPMARSDLAFEAV